MNTEVVAIDRAQYERLATLEEQTRWLIKDHGRLEAHLEVQDKAAALILEQLRNLQQERNMVGKLAGWGIGVIAAAAGYFVHWFLPLPLPR